MGNKKLFFILDLIVFLSMLNLVPLALVFIHQVTIKFLWNSRERLLRLRLRRCDFIHFSQSITRCVFNNSK